MNLPDIALYYTRLAAAYGADSKACGYSHPVAQEVRFKAYEKYMNFKDKSLLDVGCGTGDFLYWLITHNKAPSEYHGLDILPEQIESARTLFKNRGLDKYCDKKGIKVRFDVSRIDTVQGFKTFDNAVAISIFDVKQTDVPTTFKLACQTMISMFRWLKRDGSMGVDFFSPYAKEIQNFNAPIPPEWVFTWAKNNLSERIIIDHDYAPHSYMIHVNKGINHFMETWKNLGGWERNKIGEKSND